MPFRVTKRQGHLSVVPGDAALLVAAGRLDERLFDVTTLLNDGYGDSRPTHPPFIVQYDGGAPRPKIAAATMVRPLSSVAGAALSVPKRSAPTWWNSATRTDHGIRALGAGYTKIWLDGRRQLTLDHSAAQIGAPVAWQ